MTYEIENYDENHEDDQWKVAQLEEALREYRENMDLAPRGFVKKWPDFPDWPDLISSYEHS